MRILVWNVNGFNTTFNHIVKAHGTFKKFIDSYNLDVLCIQEAKLTEEKITREMACINNFESFWASSKKKKGYSGVTTWIKKIYSPIDAKIDFLGGGDGSSDLDQEGRIVMTDLGNLVIINVYIPNGGDAPKKPRLEYKLRFLDVLLDYLNEIAFKGKKPVIVGDFNVAMEVNDVHSSLNIEEIYFENERNTLRKYLKEYIDSWRFLHPEESQQFTHWNPIKNYRPSNKGIRIDYAFCHQSLKNNIVSCEIINTPAQWSDHVALLLELKDIAYPEKHEPCALSSLKLKKFKKEMTITSMFSKKRKNEKDHNVNSKNIKIEEEKLNK